MMILKYGSRGSLVELLQLGLSRAGYGPLDIDGCLGSETAAALGAFRRARGLPESAEVLPSVRAALEPYTSGRVTAYLRPGETPLAAARRFGAEPEAVRTANPGLDANLRRAASGITVPLPFEAVPKISWSTQANEHSIRALSSRYPSLMPGTWGRSAMGKRLRSLTFGDGNRTLVFTAAHHANEWITAPALLRYAGALASRYHAGDGAAVEAHRQLRVYFLPLVDPDGVDLVTGAIGEGPWLARARQIAADYPQVAWPDGWKANIRGTDLNLQYPAGWDQAKGIKYAQGWRSPAPRDYVGRAPLCAPESFALWSLTRRLRPVAVLALHTQGEVIYWNYHGYAPPGAEELAGRLAGVSGYALDDVPDESSNAGYKDWVIDELDVPAFTIECGLGENPLPIEQLAPISKAVAAICDECVASAGA